MLERLLRGFWRSWRFHPATNLATLVVLAGSFTIISLYLILQGNMSRILTRWGENVQMTVYLKDSGKSPEVAAVENFLKDHQNVGRWEYVSNQEAAARFEKQLGTYAPKLFSDPEFGNPLPASFEVKLREAVSGDRQYGQLTSLARELGQFAVVDEVSYGQGWVENYASLLRTFTSSSWLLVSVLLAGALLIIGNAIRSSVHQRRQEIEVLELVGATAAWIRTPFLFEGVVLGVLGSGVGLMASFVLYQWQKSVALEQIGFLGITAEVSFLPNWQIFSLLGLGGLLGGGGAYLCVRSLASGWAAVERSAR